MTVNGKNQVQDRLALRSRLSEMAQVPAWIEGLAGQYGIPDHIQLAMNLCLEEAVSNIIRHGYARDTERSIVLNFTMPREGFFVFAVEDEAPRFNPLDGPELGALNECDDPRVGGQGIRFLRRFADRLEYEPMPGGNRLLMGFSASGMAPRNS